MKQRTCFLHLILLFVLIPIATAQEESLRAVVLRWTEVDGVDFDRASDLTTLEFREGKTKKEWAEKIARIMKSATYKHLGGKVIGEKIVGDRAMFVL